MGLDSIRAADNEQANAEPRSSREHPQQYETVPRKPDVPAKQTNPDTNTHKVQDNLTADVVTGMAATVLAGYLIWSFQGSSRLAGFLSDRRMWTRADPLRFRESKRKERKRRRPAPGKTARTRGSMKQHPNRPDHSSLKGPHIR